MKAALKRFLASRAGWRLCAPLRPRGVYVLMYHRISAPGDFFGGVSVDNFRRQMEWLRDHCTPVWPEDVLRATQYARRGKPPVVVTFDDGYRDFRTRAWPILQELGIPAAVFLATQFMDRGGLLWTEQLEWAVRSSKATEVVPPWQPDAAVLLETEAERRAFVRAAKERLKDAEDDDRRRWLESLLDRLCAADPESVLGRQMLSWEDVRACTENTCFGGHSHTHPILSRVKDGGLDHEIRTCRDRIEGETGRYPKTFAYPNGRASDFDGRTRATLAKHGFGLSFSTIEGVNRPETDRLALRRLHNWDSGAGELAALMARTR
ncbi:MAG TPA: polysaccharide deacetylase family protein [Usitatibacter sp.]|nr:polysaccharide deacetylase family protein [Usitatibacter sp.]